MAKKNKKSGSTPATPVRASQAESTAAAAASPLRQPPTSTTTSAHAAAAPGDTSTTATTAAIPLGRVAKPSSPVPAQKDAVARPAKPAPPSVLDSLDRAVSSAVATVLSALSTALRLAHVLTIKPALLLLGWAWAPLFIVGLAAAAALLGWHTLRTSVSSLTSLSHLVSYTPLAALTPITCLLGIYCPQGSSDLARGEQPLNVGKLAHSLRVEATRANDIFESVIGMSDLGGAGGGLHQTEIWELAMSVKRGSRLEGKDILAQELVELGDLTRDMKDKLIGINSQGINSFTWIVHSFTVLEASLLQLSPPPPSSAAGSAASAPAVASRKARLALQRQLTQLISHLSSSLSALQSSVEDTIPLASRASALGGRLQEEFLVERLTLEESLAGEPVWAPLLSHAQKAVGRLKDGGAGSDEPGAFRRDIVKRDLRLASETVGRLRDIRRGMEDVREELVGYRDNVGFFRAGVVGWFAGGPEDEDEIDVAGEMDGLRSIMGRFEGALRVAKSRGRAGGGTGQVLGGERLGLAG